MDGKKEKIKEKEVKKRKQMNEQYPVKNGKTSFYGASGRNKIKKEKRK